LGNDVKRQIRDPLINLLSLPVVEAFERLFIEQQAETPIGAAVWFLNTTGKIADNVNDNLVRNDFRRDYLGWVCTAPLLGLTA